MLLWGGGWTALKILTESVNVEVVSLWRFVIMFFSFIPILFFIKAPLHLPKKGIKYVLSSSLLNILFMFFAYLGVQASTAGNGGVVITILSPLFTFLLTVFIFRQAHGKLQYLGLGIGIVGGVIMLNLHSLQIFIHGGGFYFVLAAMTWAGITIIAQKSHLHINPIHYSFFISAISMLILFTIALGHNISVVFDQDSRFWAALLYLGILGQSVATTIFYIASGRLGSAKASSFMFLVPLFALLISNIILDEVIQTNILIGGLISLVSVYLINNKRAHN